MKQLLLDLPSSSTFVKNRNKEFAKLAMGVATVVAAFVIWDEYPNIKHPISPRRHGLYYKERFFVGLMLIVYSCWFSIIGISVLANSLFILPTPIRLGTATSLQGNEDEDNEESNGKSKIIIRLLVTMIMMITLLWSTGSGIKLTTGPISETGLYTLTISIGVATAVFGLIYFMIGVIIMVELVGRIVGPLPATSKKRLNEVNSLQHSGSSDAGAIV